MHHSKPECLMFAFPSRYSTANGYSNKKQAVFTDAPKRPLPAEVVIIPLLKVLILHCTGYHIEWPTCWCHSCGKRTHCALLLGELGFGLWNLGWSKLKDFCWSCFLQGDHWLFSNHCFCIRYRNIFKDPKGIIFLHGQECFIMTCHCHHQKQKLLQIASQWWLQSLALDHRVSYSEQKVVLSSRLGNPSENDIKWHKFCLRLESHHQIDPLRPYSTGSLRLWWAALAHGQTDRWGVQGILRGTAWFMVAFWKCCFFVFNL